MFVGAYSIRSRDELSTGIIYRQNNKQMWKLDHVYTIYSIFSNIFIGIGKIEI